MLALETATVPMESASASSDGEESIAPPRFAPEIAMVMESATPVMGANATTAMPDWTA